MKVIYDRDTDTLTVIFAETPVVESDEDKPGVILDYDTNGNLFHLKSWMHHGVSIYQVKLNTKSRLWQARILINSGTNRPEFFYSLGALRNVPVAVPGSGIF